MDSYIRRIFPKRFPYGLLYTLIDDEIYVLAVMHLRRDPDYRTYFKHSRSLLPGLCQTEVFKFLKKEGKITDKLIRKLTGWWKLSGFNVDNGVRIERGVSRPHREVEGDGW